MDKNLLVGWWRLTLPVPPAIWEKVDQGEGNPLEFMSEDHHRVRDFAVNELTRSGRPLAPEHIAQQLRLSQARVMDILHELERHKTFLFRNEQGQVTWAYPVTVDRTPHRVSLSTDEAVTQVYAA